MSVELASLINLQKICLAVMAWSHRIFISHKILNLLFSYTPLGFCLDPRDCPLQFAFSMQCLVNIPCRIVISPFILTVNQVLTLIDNVAYTLCSLRRHSTQW